MKIFGVLFILIGIATTISAQKTGTNNQETEAVKVPLNNYLQAHATGKAEFIRQAFQTDARITAFRDGKMSSLSVEDFAKLFNGKTADDEAKRKRTIDTIDVSGNAAIAKITLDYPKVKFTDYMTLLRIDGEWKIVNKSFYMEPKQAANTAK